MLDGGVAIGENESRINRALMTDTQLEIINILLEEHI